MGVGRSGFGKNHSEGIDTFNIGVQCLAKRLALHLAEFSLLIVGWSLEFVAVKKFGKAELENDKHHNKRPGHEFSFIFHLANYNEGICTFDIGVQCIQCSAKRLALHLAEFSPSIVHYNFNTDKVCTVQPVLNGPVFSGHPLLSSQLSKSLKLLPLITVMLTSRSPLTKS